MKRRPGFTFIELLMVMLFISALAALAVPRFRVYKARAYIASMQSDLANLRIAEESYWAEHQKYVTDTTALDFRRTSHVQITITSQDVIGGYTAVATHNNAPGQQCTTAMGAEAAPREPGRVFCGAASTGSGAIPATP